MRGLVLLFSVLVSANGCADRLLLFPSTRPIDAHGAKRRTVDAGEHRMIEIWTARNSNQPTQPQAYILEFTGNGTRAEEIATFVARRWRAHDVEVWAVNYPGYGGSTGPAKLASIAPAALQA